ncbi:MAG: nucleoside deaminase [DPANN group archaeon]|nr:nucleoside deaminase [DPANN group archaeon]
MDDERFMRLALARSAEGMEEGQTPFGACIVGKDGEVISCEHNRVWKDTDVTAHGEIVAIREACRKTGSIKLEGATIYSTTEPCPMCFSAIHWAGIGRIVFGASIRDAKDAGFSELTISNEEMKKRGNSPVEIEGGILKEECAKQFKDWAAREDHRTY